MKKTTTTAVIYARYSSHAQNEASIEQQVDKCREYATRAGITIMTVYADKAISGTTDRRPEFQRMMKDAKCGTFQAVIAWKSNRMGRNMLDAMLNDAKLMEYGVRCLYVEEDFGDTAAGRFALRNMMNVNQFYSENMAEDIRRGQDDNARQCRVNGSIPYGYRAGADGHYEIDEHSAAIVKEIFGKFVDGVPLVRIGEDLNARHITTGFGKPWGKNSFHRILSNERYTGIYIYRDTRIEGGIPRIIDDETFSLVQDKLRRRSEVAGRRRENDEYLLTGKLFCGKCLAPMTGVSGTSKTGASHGYYICRSRRMDKICDKKNVRKEEAERLVAEALIRYVLRDDVIEWVADTVMRIQEELKKQSQLGYYQDRLVAVKRSQDNIMRAIEAGIFNETTKTRLDELEKESAELKSMIATEKATMTDLTRDQVIYYMEQFRSGDADDPAFRKKLFDSFLDKAYLTDDTLRIVFNYTEGKNEVSVPVALDGESVESSFKLSTVPPTTSETNPLIEIHVINGRFVIIVPLEEMMVH